MIKYECLCSYAVDRFLEPFTRGARQDTRTKVNRVCVYTVQCRVIVDNMCDFQHSSLSRCLQLRCKTREQNDHSEIRQDSPTQEDTFTSRRV